MSDPENSERESGGGATQSGSSPRYIPEAVLGLDRVFEALAHPRRRYLLYSLSESAQPTLMEIASKLAAWENDVPVETVWDEERDRVFASLFHSHVPKLVELGIIEFDRDREVIVAGEHAQQVFAVLEGAGSSIDADQESHARREDR